MEENGPCRADFPLFILVGPHRVGDAARRRGTGGVHRSRRRLHASGHHDQRRGEDRLRLRPGWAGRTRCASTWNRRLPGSCDALEQAGATPADVVKIRIFVKDFEPAQYPTIAEARLANFPTEDQWPASTMIGVRALAAESLRVEIEAIAVGGRAGRRPADRALRAVERVQRCGGGDGARHTGRSYVAGQVGAGGLPRSADRGGMGARRAAARRGGSIARRPDQGDHLYRRLRSGGTDLPAYRAGREQALALDDMPASTLLGIPKLAAGPVPYRDRRHRGGRRGRQRRREREYIDPTIGFTQVVDGARHGSEGRPRYPAKWDDRGIRSRARADQVYASPAAPPGRGRGGARRPAEGRHLHAGVHPAATSRWSTRPRRAHGFPDEAVPAATLLGIQSLFANGALLEIEGVAVVEPWTVAGYFLM